jgi:GTP cyclohydrolase II
MTEQFDEYRIDGPARLPLKFADRVERFNLLHFTFETGRWIAAWTGSLEDAAPMPLRIESACVFGHVFNSRQCDCGFQLYEASRRIAEGGRGLIIYALDQDARGLGTAAHFEIYRMRQVEQLDTEEVFDRLGAELDVRDYSPVITILRHLGLDSVHLLSNNAKRVRFLESHGITVTKESLVAPMDVHNMSTLMLELEDLGYEMDFRTHADWLAPLQAKVADDPQRTAALLIVDNERVLWEEQAPLWGLRSRLTAPDPETAARSVLYLTDMPRLDEIAEYGRWGVPVVVVAHAYIAPALRTAAEEAGVRLVDWARRNAWTSPRPQWELTEQRADGAVYTRDDAARLVATGAEVDADSGWESIVYAEAGAADRG